MSALTGGPEDNSFGPQGRLYTVSPVNGEPTLLAKGLAGAVGVAVAPEGDVFATELFGNRIVRLRDGSGTPQLFRKAHAAGGHRVVAQRALRHDQRAEPEAGAGRLVRFDN